MFGSLRVRQVGRLALLLTLTLLLLIAWAPYALADDPPESVGTVVSSTALWGLIVGAVTPTLLAVIQQPGWSTRTRSLVAFAVSAILAAITCAVDGSIGHGQTVLITIGTVYIAAQATYQGLWKQIGVTQAIEGATSRTASPDEGRVTTRKPARRGG